MYNAVAHETCCGCILLMDFGYDYPDPLKKSYRKNKKELLKWLNKMKRDYSQKAFLVATLNSRQHAAIGKVFEDAGFVEACHGYNGPEHNNNYLFVYSFDQNGRANHLKKAE